MSKKVEEAIETLKCMRLYFSDCEVCTDNDCDKKPCDNLKAIAIVLNYIEKLEFKYQARKDRYETKIKKLEEENRAYIRQLNGAFDRGFIHKDKIRDKIEELNKELTNEITSNDGFAEYREYAIEVLEIQIQVLKELLEEE